MSMIGDFGLCTKNDYNILVTAIKNDQFDIAEELIAKICSELESSTPQMEDNPCSGEVFLALFDYFETELGINIGETADLEKLNEYWRGITEDYAMTVFTEKEKLQFLSLANQIDYEQVTQYINDFYQNDYGDIGQTVCNVLLGNINKMNEDQVLIWHLY